LLSPILLRKLRHEDFSKVQLRERLQERRVYLPFLPQHLEDRNRRSFRGKQTSVQKVQRC